MIEETTTQCLIISGRSGSGKSTALQSLEDLGYYCVDNMPLVLLPTLLDQLMGQQQLTRVAIGVDARNQPEQLAGFDNTLSHLNQQKIPFQVIYLDASDRVLLQRYDATRRKHPLSNHDRSLAEAIEYESRLLASISTKADIAIDTSRLDVHSLRSAIRQRLGVKRQDRLMVRVLSFAFKHGIPTDADLMFDVRVLPNPHWQPALREYTGNDQAVIDFMDQKPESQRMLNDITQFIQHWLPAFENNDRSYLTIAIGCTGGQHRSVYLANKLAAELLESHPGIQLRHRDCPVE